MKNDEILILGAGSFGTCLAQHIAGKGEKINIWDIDSKVCQEINASNMNSKYFPDIKLNKRIKAYTALEDVISRQPTFIINAIPTQYTRSVYKKLKKILKNVPVFISASKGIENKTLKFPMDIIAEEFNPEIYMKSCILSGPSFAIEVLNGQPTAVSIAGRDPKTLTLVQNLLHTTHFRAYSNDDPLGLEISGALKNIIAIAVGAVDGMGYQQNTKAALITRGLNEISRFGEILGAKKSTFLSLGGMGDIILTCGSTKSRNYSVGYHIGAGATVEEAIKRAGTTAEGVTTSISAYMLANNHNIDAPICKEVYRVLHENKSIEKAFNHILNRPMTSEL